MASASSKSKQITNPRRLLILSPPTQSTSIIPPLLHSLTGIPIQDPPQSEALGAPSQSLPDADTDTPQQTTTSFAGYTTHSPLNLNTKYYTAEVPIWVDEVPLSSETQWRTEFLSDEAEEVRDAVGALLVAVRNASEADPVPGPDPGSREDVRALRDLMRDIGAVKEKIDEERGGVGDVAGVFVLVGASKRKPPGNTGGTGGVSDELELGVEDGEGEGIEEAFSAGWWEDQLFDAGLVGWEVIEWDPKAEGGEKTRNKFGEYEGMPRIKEVLETHDWSGGSNDEDPDFGLDDDDLETELLGYSRSEHTPGFGHEVQELEREMFGLRMAIERGGGDGEEFDEEEEEEENKVESMEALMMRVQAIRDMGADLPESERKKFAAKAVNDLMREL